MLRDFRWLGLDGDGVGVVEDRGERVGGSGWEVMSRRACVLKG